MMMHARHRGWLRRAQAVCLLGLLAVLGLAGCAASSSSLSGPVLVARVNGNGIGLSSYQQFMTYAERAGSGTLTSWQSPSGRTAQASLQSAVLNFLIDVELAREQARACGVSVSQKDIAVQKQQLLSTANSVLKDPTNSAWATYHALVVTPAALQLFSEQQAYQAKLIKVLHLPTAHISYIVVSSRQQAESLLQQAQHGADFAKLGQQVQSNPSGTASYSDVGVQYVGEFLPDFDKVVFAVGKPTKPGCYNNLRYSHAPEEYRMFALTGQSAGQYVVVQTTGIANMPVSTIGDANTEGSVFSAWIDEIVRLPGNSSIEKYSLPATTAGS
jgi:SurA N-terminal domain/PPIC-type PPIASE domain